jgi:hypothetical protein
VAPGLTSTGELVNRAARKTALRGAPPSELRRLILTCGTYGAWPGVRRAGVFSAEPGADAGPGAAKRRRLIITKA